MAQSTQTVIEAITKGLVELITSEVFEAVAKYLAERKSSGPVTAKELATALNLPVSQNISRMSLPSGKPSFGSAVTPSKPAPASGPRKRGAKDKISDPSQQCLYMTTRNDSKRCTNPKMVKDGVVVSGLCKTCSSKKAGIKQMELMASEGIDPITASEPLEQPKSKGSSSKTSKRESKRPPSFSGAHVPAPGGHDSKKAPVLPNRKSLTTVKQSSDEGKSVTESGLVVMTNKDGKMVCIGSTKGDIKNMVETITKEQDEECRKHSFSIGDNVKILSSSRTLPRVEPMNSTRLRTYAGPPKVNNDEDGEMSPEEEPAEDEEENEE